MTLRGSHRFVGILVLVACSESPKDRLDRLTADTDTTCWNYSCKSGPNAYNYPPTTPTADGVTCMNDALASGARARAWWSTEDFGHSRTYTTFVFADDHQVKVFQASQDPYADPVVTERPTCTGPFRIGSSICGALDPSSPTNVVPVSAIAWDGCP